MRVVLHLARALTIFATCLLQGTLLAHGGQYRGPTTGSGPGGPTSPGMVRGGPLTGGNANLDVSSWRVWWELNHDRYVHAGRVTEIDDSVRRTTVVPSLALALERTANPDVSSASLIALGKTAEDPVVVEILRACLRRNHLEVREAAVLGLGLSGRSEAFDDLDALLEASARGRRLVARDDVGDRVRTFAAYALGLLANRSDDAALKGKVLDSLVEVLDDRRSQDRDVLTGVLNGIRLIAPDVERGGTHKRVLWTAVAALERYLGRRFKDRMAAVQSHALTALAVLVGRGDDTEQQRAKALVAARLKLVRQDPMVYVSATIALGRLLQPGDEEPLELLVRRVARPPTPMVRKLGLIALGEIGGPTAYQQLRKAFRQTKRDVQAWAALGLGILAYHALPPAENRQGQTGDLRTEVGALLLEGLGRNNNKDVLAAIAIGLGLAGHAESAEHLRRLLEKYRALGDFSGHLCVGLGLLGDRESIPAIRSCIGSVDHSVRFGHAALALSRVGQLDVSGVAVSVLRAGGGNGPGQLRRLGAAAKALGHLRNPADLPALARVVQGARAGKRANSELLKVAFTVAALGSIADRDPLGFGARVADGMNYTAKVQTLSNGRNGILDIF